MMITALLLAVAAVPSGWDSYVNARFGYSVCYPRDLTPQRVADNGDGRAFVGADGAKMLVWGSLNALDENIARAAARDRTRLAGEGVRITYEVKRPGWHVLSGRGPHGVVYVKSRLAGDRFVTVELRYPMSGAARWKDRVARIASCLSVEAR